MYKQYRMSYGLDTTFHVCVVHTPNQVKNFRSGYLTYMSNLIFFMLLEKKYTTKCSTFKNPNSKFHNSKIYAYAVYFILQNFDSLAGRCIRHTSAV